MTTPARYERSAGAPLRHAGLLTIVLLSGACTPTVALQAPRDPIVINLNVKLEQEVRVRVEREVDDVITSNPGIF